MNKTRKARKKKKWTRFSKCIELALLVQNWMTNATSFELKN